MRRVRLVARQRRFAGREPLEQVLVVLARGIDLLLALRGRETWFEVQCLVHDRQVARVVDIALVGGHQAVDAHPELHVDLELGRLGDGGGARRGSRARRFRDPGHRQQEQEQR